MKVLNMSEVRIVALATATAWFSFAHHLKVNIVISTKVRNVALAATTARFSRAIVFHGFLDFQSEAKLLSIFNDFMFVRPSPYQKS